jgi:RND family efflux transporter MFP subunit
VTAGKEWRVSDELKRAGVVAVAGLIVAAACARPAAPPSTTEARAPVSVRTAPVERDEGPGQAAIPGAVQAGNRAALSARVAASVVALPYREGDAVAAGAVVARLHDPALRSGLEAAQAASDAAETDRARVQALLARDAATPREADESRARAAAAAAALAAARDDLEYAVLRAPFAGTIAARHVDLGDVVAPGRPIVEIEGRGALEVRATVEPEIAARLRPGQELQAAVDGQPELLPATVLAVASSGDTATHRFEVRATLPDRPGLRSGLFARLLVPSPSAEARLLVPSAALLQRGGLTGVFVLDGSRARLRWVAPGASQGGRTEVRAGVAAGETVVIDPGPLQDGDPVTAAGAGDR